MKILILCHHSLVDEPYHDWINPDESMQLYLFIDKQAYAASHEILMQHSREYAEIRVFSDWSGDARIETEAINLVRNERIDSVVALGELDIIRAAKIRQLLGIEGQKVQSALAFRNKVLMKRILRSHGIPVPNFRYIEQPIDLVDFIEKNGLPVFLKPVFGAGSVGSVVIRTRSDLDKVLCEHFKPRVQYGTFPSDMEVEEYIHGDLYHVDGLYASNRLLHIVSSKYLSQHLDLKSVQQVGYWGSVSIPDRSHVAQCLKAYVKKVLTALPTPDLTAFHSEIFYTDDSKVLLCEIACRPPGGKLSEAFRQRTGVSLPQVSCLHQCGLAYKHLLDSRILPNEYIASILILTKQGILKKYPTNCPFPFVLSHELIGSQGLVYSAPMDSCDELAHFCLSGSDEDDLKKNVDKTLEWIRTEIEWDLAESEVSHV